MKKDPDLAAGTHVRSGLAVLLSHAAVGLVEMVEMDPEVIS